jgi:hypothetical protein
VRRFKRLLNRRTRTPLPSPPLYALAVRTAATNERKVLLVNKRNANVTVTVPAGGTLHIVDPASVGAASADGIRQEVVSGSRKFVSL